MIEATEILAAYRRKWNAVSGYRHRERGQCFSPATMNAVKP